MKITLDPTDLKPEYKGTSPLEVTFEMLTPEAQAVVKMSANGGTYEDYSHTHNGVPWKDYPLWGPLKILPILICLAMMVFTFWAAFCYGLIGMIVAGPFTLLVFLGFQHTFRNARELVVRPVYGDGAEPTHQGEES